tara:strand:+ start:2993 stop:3703 length:711 start_codon:yes stop_codon:yes gene_type:complete
MINRGIARYLAKNKKYKNTPVVDTADLTAIDGELRLTTNGIPSLILIQYKGVVFFHNQMPITIKSNIGKNTILITNLFKLNIPELMYYYSGDLEITNCKIMSFNNNSILANINNKQRADIVNSSDTKFEDDSITLREGTRDVFEGIRRGSTKFRFDESKFDENNKVQKYGKREREEITAAVIKTASSLIDKKTGKLDKTVSSKPTRQPRPSRQARTSSKPTRTTVESPSRKKGGKY